MDDPPATVWAIRGGVMHFSRTPRIMGILNVTPDSFSDGNRFFDSSAAVDRGLQMQEDGADIIDIGGESTRPYSTPVEANEEMARVVPVIQRLAERLSVPISIDTSKAIVAREAVAAGAQIINDVSGLEGDPEMVDVARQTQAGVCVMHMRGKPSDMQDNPSYDDVVAEIESYLFQRLRSLVDLGIDHQRICLDPGIGFGKTHDHNLCLLRHVDRFLGLGRPILVGHSRKGFIAKLIGDKEADRMAGTLGVTLAMAAAGVQIVRVHDVRQTADAIRLFAACRP
jgi:dihydropteroate synthase